VKKAWAILLIFSMAGLVVGQDTPVTIRKEVESAFVYPADGDQPFGKRENDVVYGTIIDPLSGKPIQEITWRGIEMHHERGFTSPGFIRSSELD
jgi:hypothetical protein